MSTALSIVLRLGPGKHSLASILLGQRQDDLSCDGGWGCRVSIPVFGGDQLCQCYPHLFGPDSDDKGLGGGWGLRLKPYLFSLSSPPAARPVIGMPYRLLWAQRGLEEAWDHTAGS